MKILADGHQLFFRRQHHALAGFRCPPLDAPAPEVEGKGRSEHAAENGRKNTRPIRHGIYLRRASPHPLTPSPVGRGGTMGERHEVSQPADNAFRLAGGSIFAKSSATAARRAATSRSVCFA